MASVAALQLALGTADIGPPLPHAHLAQRPGSALQLWAPAGLRATPGAARH